MFCSKCGNQLPEGAKFCGKCGAPVEEVNAAVPEAGPMTSEPVTPVSVETEEPEGTGRRLSNRNLIIIGLAAVVVAAVIMLFASIGSSYRKPIRQYFSGWEHLNANKIANCTAPFIYESEGYSKSEFRADVQEEFDLEKEYGLEAGSLKISYTIEDVRDCGTYEISSVLDDMAWYYDLDYSDIPNVKKMKSVYLDVTMKYDYDGEQFEETDSGTMYVGKIGSKWYMIDME